MINSFVRLGVEGLERRDTPSVVSDFWDVLTTDPRAGAAAFYEGYSKGAVNIVNGARDALTETVNVGRDVVTILTTEKGESSTRKTLIAVASLPAAIATTSDHDIDPTQMRSSLFRGAADTAGDPDAAMKFDNTLLYGIVTMGVGPLAISGVKAAASGDSDEFSKQAGGFGVMVIAPYGIGRAIGYVRGPVVTVENPITNPVPELPPSPLPRMPGSPNAALPPVAIPPELIPITDNLFRIMFEEVTAVPAPVKKIQVIEGVQAGTDGTPTTGVSGTSTTNVPGVNTSPLPAPPKGTPPPGNCGLPNALGNAVDPATATLPEGPISATSGGFRLRNAGEGGGPKLVRLVTNCEECANLIGQNPGRLTPTGYPPDAVLTVVRDPIRLPNGEVIPVGGEILVNGRGQPTFNGQPIDLPSNTEFGFTPPPRWDQGQTLGLPSPALTLQPVAELPVGPAAAAGAAINAGRSPDR